MKKPTAKNSMTMTLAAALLISLSNAGPGSAKNAAKSSTKIQATAGAPRQRIFSLSADQQNSEILKVWGVPACVLLGSERPRGLYITGLTGEGLAKQINLDVGDVLLSLNGHVILSARQADEILVKIPSGSLKAVIARQTSGAKGPEIALYNPTIAYTASPLNQSYGGSRSASQSGGSPSAAGSSSVTLRDKVDAQTIGALEDYMFSLVNKDRADNGLPPLAKSSTLGALARRYAENMARRNFFSHDDPDGNDPRGRARAAGIHESVWENLAKESGSNPLKDLVLRGEQQMMAEPPGQLNHRGCILLPKHQCVGIGVAVAGRTVYAVQEFSPSSLP